MLQSFVGIDPTPLNLTLTQFGFGECLALTLFPSLPKTSNNIKTTTSKTKMYSVCAVGPNFPPCKQQGFSWLAQFAAVNHLNLLCCVPTSCMCMLIVAPQGKVGALGSMHGAPRLFGGFPTPIRDGSHRLVFVVNNARWVYVSRLWYVRGVGPCL